MKLKMRRGVAKARLPWIPLNSWRRMAGAKEFSTTTQDSRFSTHVQESMVMDEPAEPTLFVKPIISAESMASESSLPDMTAPGPLPEPLFDPNEHVVLSQMTQHDKMLIRNLEQHLAQGDAAPEPREELPELYFPLPHEEDASPMHPKFWTGKPALAEKDYKIDCREIDFSRMLMPNENGEMVVNTNCREAESLLERMDDLFQRTGIVYLADTGLEETDHMRAVVGLLKPECIIYEGGANLRNANSYAKNVYDTGAPREADLQYHHEMAYVSESTKYVSFLCEAGTRDPMKGATFISENNGATRDLMEHPSGLFEKLQKKGLCYVRKLPDRKYFLDNPSTTDPSTVYNYWQTSMLTEDPDEAVEVAKSKGLECEWQDSKLFGRYLVTKFYISAFEYDPFNDANVLYASIADDYHWFDSWPGVMNLPHHERPLKFNFGDDEVMRREEKQVLVDVYDNNGIPVPWKKGEIAIICNYRTAHGRFGYALEPNETRELGVVLGERLVRQGPLDGKWTSWADANGRVVPERR